MYSFHVKPISRLRGESIVKVAAYQSRGRMFDEREGATYDFTHKNDLLFSHFFAPADTPPELIESREVFWNAVDNAEKQYDARTARTLWGALPNVLPTNENVKIAYEFVRFAVLPQGMCADVAIHSGEKKNIANSNPHVHILIPDRPVSYAGFSATKNRAWNQPDIICQWRKQWELVLNRAYERNGFDTRVSCESLEIQGINREPTKHLGRAATEMERRGERTVRGDLNRNIIARNGARKNMERKRQLEFERSWELDLSR